MARKVFFSFHYKYDIWRVGQVRNSWLLQKGETNTFMDAADWEAVKKRGEPAVRAWIDRQLHGTGVMSTAVTDVPSSSLLIIRFKAKSPLFLILPKLNNRNIQRLPPPS